VVRIDGVLQHAPFDPLSTADTDAAAMELLPVSRAMEFKESNEADVGYTLPGVGRFRVNVFRQRGNVNWPSAGFAPTSRRSTSCTSHPPWSPWQRSPEA
jgi:Tfp pilus assembly pilus retraction ATPase PilT